MALWVTFEKLSIPVHKHLEINSNVLLNKEMGCVYAKGSSFKKYWCWACVRVCRRMTVSLIPHSELRVAKNTRSSQRNVHLERKHWKCMSSTWQTAYTHGTDKHARSFSLSKWHLPSIMLISHEPNQGPYGLMIVSFISFSVICHCDG